eukprot:gnl/TRDRNA2_/TRDRNA2_83184_c0_seq1.p1 gnl/TRDRNA2_/TRDRNA2_83184_c0~~gnl/TRDRNA2_/TRDRNA2_83184_c0_seq1.p1  ORF type:complete len:317 (-),score=65.73 gnl/TRDRNA2_/TRDRNA2_83184_c0_seq1:130-1080(-)
MAPLDAYTSNVNADDYYEVLGVSRMATDSEIAKAYKKLALKHHPDKNPDNKEQAEYNFKRVTEAYDVLREPEKRRNYDQYGKTTSQGFGGARDGGVSFQQADDIFRAFFGQHDPFSMFMDGQQGNMPFRSSSRFTFGDMQGGGGGHRRFKGGRQIPAHAVPVGATVFVRGLAKAPQHNGKFGKVLSWDEEKCRYEVDAANSGVLLLKPQNIMQRCAVEAVGLESKPELNGMSGDIGGFDEEKGRYTVMMPNAGVVGLQPGNCILKSGTRVLVQGLSNDQFNGQMGSIVDVDRMAGRYTVQCQNGKQIKIRYDNVLC